LLPQSQGLEREIAAAAKGGEQGSGQRTQDVQHGPSSLVERSANINDLQACDVSRRDKLGGCLHHMHARASVVCMQYTIRNIPPELDGAIKARAKKLGKSVNQVALELLTAGTGQAIRHRSLRDMPGAWSDQEAAELDRFLAEHRKIDPELWK
jgi:hypothetical protein